MAKVSLPPVLLIKQYERISANEGLSMEQLMSLHRWVSAALPKLTAEGIFMPSDSSTQALVLLPLTGDAGFRQYYRVNTSPECLLVRGPKQPGKSESGAHFADLSSVLHQHGVPTPLIYACDIDNNYLLIESFGGTDLLDVLSADTVEAYYSLAQSTLIKLQQVDQLKDCLPVYDNAMLLQELALFPEWFVETMLGHELSSAERSMFDQLASFLSQRAAEQPQVVVHRDYHSRNIMYRDSGELGVIDFQDAVYGPITYDLASLLKDCYVRWPPEDVQRWAMDYMKMAIKAGVMPEVSSQQFVQWFDLMGLQRHIKVLGIFARLSLRDGKNRYLSDLPLVMRYTLETAQKYPHTQAFAQWFERVLLPMIMLQPWYHDHNIAGDVR
ncbi:MAG: aminoglycoside/choline kinase family phosphotransferase [Candidatus Endobugula sp.]